MVFRTLALKSVMKFGKYADWSVVQLLSMNKHRYLLWVYYNTSHISFLPEILEMLDIIEDRLIEKPGTNSEYYVNHKYDFKPEYDELTGKIHQRWVQNQQISEDRNRRNHENWSGSKYHLQQKNQGKF